MNWSLVTRLGEGIFLLPAALIGASWLTWRAGARATALSWMVLLALAIALTTGSKLAFMGWGVGVASLDFTGVSGHAMFAAAVYPMLARIVTVNAPASAQNLAFSLGVTLAIWIAVSRLEVNAHSVSEVVAGAFLGLAATGLTLRLHPMSTTASTPWIPMVLLVCLLAIPIRWSTSLTHQMVTHWALSLSSRTLPFTRADLHRAASFPDSTDVR